MPGKVVHFEIPAKDVKRASAFYKAVFDWWIMAMPGVDYTMLGGDKGQRQGRVLRVRLHKRGDDEEIQTP